MSDLFILVSFKTSLRRTQMKLSHIKVIEIQIKLKNELKMKPQDVSYRTNITHEAVQKKAALLI